MSDVIKDIWKEGGDGHFTFNNPSKYIDFFQDYQATDFKFIGRIIEFGPGNGEFAKWMLDTYETITDYTIVDAPRSIEIPKKTLEDYKQVNFYEAQDFKEALKKSYDIFVAFNCLSETPPSYYKEIFETVKTKGIFILDGDINDNEFQKHLDRFSQKMKARVIQGRLAPCKGIHPKSKKVIEGLYNTLPNKYGKLIPIGGRVSLHTRNI